MKSTVRKILSAFMMASLLLAACTVQHGVPEATEKNDFQIFGFPSEVTRVNSGSFGLKTKADYFQFKIGRLENIDCAESANYSIPLSAGNPITYDTLNDGIYVLCIREILANSLNAQMNPFVSTFTVDTTPPQVAVLNPVFKNKLKLDLGVIEESTPVQVAWNQVSGPFRMYFDNKASENVEVSVREGKEGVFELSLYAVDAAGNQTEKNMIAEQSAGVSRPSIALGPRTITNTPSFVKVSAAGESPLSYRWEFFRKGNEEVIWSKTTTDNIVNIEELAKFGDQTYELRVEVKDGLGEVASEVTEVVIDRTPPTVDAGQDIFVQDRNQVALIGTADDEFGISEVVWRQVTGDERVKIANPKMLNTVVDIAELGSEKLEFSLTVMDRAGNVATDHMTIYYDDQAPRLEIDKEKVVNTSVFALKNMGAWDASPLRYLWTSEDDDSKIQILEPRKLSPTIKLSEQGRYRLNLTVEDAAGNRSSELIKMTFEKDDASAPFVKTSTEKKKPGIADDRFSILYGLDEEVVGSKRYIKPTLAKVPEGVSYNWKQISGPGKLTFLKPDSVSTEVRGTQSGTYEVQLSLSYKGEIKTSRTYEYYWDQDAPVVSLKFDLLAGKIGVTSVVADESSGTKSFLWRQVSGPSDLIVGTAYDKTIVFSDKAKAGRYQLVSRVCDRYANCTEKLFSVDIPNSTSHDPSNITFQVLSGGVLAAEIASLPLMSDGQWTCKAIDLTNQLEQICDCQATVCKAKLETDYQNHERIAYYRYELSFAGKLFYQADFSVETREKLKTTNISH